MAKTPNMSKTHISETLQVSFQTPRAYLGGCNHHRDIRSHPQQLQRNSPAWHLQLSLPRTPRRRYFRPSGWSFAQGLHLPGAEAELWSDFRNSGCWRQLEHTTCNTGCHIPTILQPSQIDFWILSPSVMKLHDLDLQIVRSPQSQECLCHLVWMAKTPDISKTQISESLITSLFPDPKSLSKGLQSTCSKLEIQFSDQWKMHETSVQIPSNLLFEPQELTLKNLSLRKHWAFKPHSPTPQSRARHSWHLQTFALTSSSWQCFHRTEQSVPWCRSHLRLEARSTWLPKIRKDTRCKNIKNV